MIVSSASLEAYSSSPSGELMAMIRMHQISSVTIARAIGHICEGYFIFKEIVDNVNQGEKQMEEKVDEEEYFDHKRHLVHSPRAVLQRLRLYLYFFQCLPTRPRERSSASNIVSYTLSTLVHDQQFVVERMEMIEKRNKKMMEHEKKKTRFLKIMMDTLQKLCGSGDDADDVL
ncbi:hypothetical protein KY285_007870 [Solanum tuberosum]|nr:hypothetical protein KY289_008267 [Solanum tuberosum]KAH0746213.1 hypothetical protein KY285_007870 [Solanum tuberosum]